MKMFDIGRVCMKIAGRDAGKKCVIIDVIDAHYVLVDGQTRRRKCNIKHLEPLTQTVQVTKNAPEPEVVRVLKELNIFVEEKKPKVAKTKAERPKRIRKKKEKPVRETKAKPSRAPKKKAAPAPEEKPADKKEKDEKAEQKG
jgi:large subunit ribosomal protein L14e